MLSAFSSVRSPLYDQQSILVKSPKDFLTDDYKLAAVNDLNQLKAILEGLVLLQVNLLCTDPEALLPVDCEVNDDEKLQENLQSVLKASRILVKSVWCPNNVCLNESNKVKILQKESESCVPPVFDALLYVFSLSDEKFRQKHFRELISFYFTSLRNALGDKISRFEEEMQTSILLPVVKFKLTRGLDDMNSNGNQLLENLINYKKTPLVNQEDIYEIVENKLSSTNYDLLGYKLIPIKGANGHFGEYFTLKVLVKQQELVKNFKFFVKIVSIQLAGGTSALSGVIGKKEDFFYNTLLPLFKNHKLEKLLDFSPTCYISRLKWTVLDDMNELGFTSLKSNSILRFEGIKIFLAKLAHLHACTIICEEKISEKLGETYRLSDEYEEYLQDIFFSNKEEPLGSYDDIIDTILQVLKKFPDLKAKLQLPEYQLRSKLSKVFFSFQKGVFQKSNSLRNVVNHGDMYVGNVLVKLEDNLIEDGVLIDFQALRYIPPAHEVQFFIYINSFREERDKHMSDFLNFYYEEFSGHLEEFGVSAEKVFPRKDFDCDVKATKSAAIAIAYIYAHALRIGPDLKQEIMSDPKKGDYYFIEHKNELVDIGFKDENYKELMRGLVEDFIDLVNNKDC